MPDENRQREDRIGAASPAVPRPPATPPGRGLDLSGLLKFAVAQGVSDIHLKPGRTPVFRRGAAVDLVGPRGMPVLTERDVLALFEGLLADHHRARLAEAGEVDLAWGETGVGRFRINLFRGRAGHQAVLRVIPVRIPTLADLGLPRVVETITQERRGLVLVTGATGQGKTTTLAALADQINRQRACHIVTIEDPIEYVVEDRRAVVTQRQVGLDTRSFHDGLRAALRQDPDVIIVGEMRDRETIETALTAAETGHLVLSTLHTTDARETVNRILAVFEPSAREYARVLMASVLRAVVSQRLVTRADGKGRVPAVEVLIATGRVRDLLKAPDGVDELPEAIARGHSQYGMQTFDQSLLALFREGRITYDEALTHCSNPSDFALRVKGISSQSGFEALDEHRDDSDFK